MRRPGPAAVARLAWLALALAPLPLGAQVMQQPPKPPEPEPAKPPEAKPIESIGVPQAEPPPVQPPPPETAPLEPAAQAAPPERLTQDTVADPGYLPGYRRVPSLGLSPYTPQVGAFPGGLTPGFAAPMPPNEWTFQFTGFMNVSAQFGVSHRPNPAPGQSDVVFHVPPNTPEEYQSFVSTAAVPGNWVQMNFRYGNRDVTANLTLSTWNPSEPTTYYQIGSQNFIQNAFLTYNVAPLGRLKLQANLGYFFTNYGNLGEYTAGIYQAPYVGAVRGIGENVLADYPLTPELTLVLEEGFMGNRNGHAPTGTAPATPNNNIDPLFGSSYIHHLHAGLVRKTDITLYARLHWIVNFGRDDRPQFDVNGNPLKDNMVTRPIDESHIPDGSISVYGLDAGIKHPTWGYLAIGGSRIDAHYSYPLRGLFTFGGEGYALTERWLGVDTGGTGSVDVVGINWDASLGKILASPRPFDSNGPDLLIRAGAVVAQSHTVSPQFDGRVRYKYGADLLYPFLSYMAVGGRLDRVVPDSRDGSQTYHVLQARLVFKTDWQSREAIVLQYAKWFYGPHTHPDYSTIDNSLPLPRLDDQLFAVNVNMWW